MPTIMVDADTEILSGGTVEMVTVWAEDGKGGRSNTGEQERDERGRHKWRVSAILPGAGDGDRPEIISVQVYALEEPKVGNLADPLQFHRLRCRPSVNRRTNMLTLYWDADDVRLRNGAASRPVATAGGGQ